MGFIDRFLLDIRTQKTPFHSLLYHTAKRLRMARLPFPRFYGALLYRSRNACLTGWRRFKQLFFFDPMLRYRCKQVGKGVYFESKFPLIMGYGDIYIGDRLGISGNATMIASYKTNPNPTIVIGDDVYLGYATTLSCADRITIGNRVLIAHFASIFDNNNHPIDPRARAANQPVGKEDIAPVVIEDDAWIGAYAIILKGVTVGRGSVVAMGAVVTKDVPPMTVVAGNPARVVKQIMPADNALRSDINPIKAKDS
jgi:acetyltransferase-like isoleucine patch superfamily enzyme